MNIDPKKLIEDYVARSSWRVRENSNNDFSYPSLRSHIANKVMGDYALDTYLPKDLANLHKLCRFHIHDLGHFLAPYCMGHSLRDLLQEGFNGIKGRAGSNPPKHLRSACIQMANFLGTLQSEASGAQAFNGVDTFLAAFIKKDNLDYTEVYQSMQELIYNLNIPTRSGEIPFTNFSFDWVCPKDLATQNPFIGGEVMDFTYGDCQTEMDLVNKVFIEILMKGDKDGRMFGFPIPTYSVTKDFAWDSENAKLLFELTAKYGSPYFQNFINSDLDPSSIRSMCCRLSLRLDELRKRGGIFNSWDLTGSIQVVTINLPQLGYRSTSEADFFERLSEILHGAKNVHEIKRKYLNELLEKGLFPYLSRWLPKGFRNHFSTIGIVGMQECLKNLFTDERSDIYTPQGKEFSIKVCNYILEHLKQFQMETGNLYNFEETPAEGVCYRFAKHDKEMYPYIYTSGETDSPFYTQGAKLPFDHSDDIFNILEHQQDISTLYTGGSVQHIFLGEQLSGTIASKIIKTVLTNYKTPYVTLSPTFSICKDHGFHSGEHLHCPTCGTEMEVYSRIVGYYSPLHRWNLGKQAEFDIRKTFESVKYKQQITRIDE